MCQSHMGRRSVVFLLLSSVCVFSSLAQTPEPSPGSVKVQPTVVIVSGGMRLVHCGGPV
jgi:hypothetical protein